MWQPRRSRVSREEMPGLSWPRPFTGGPALAWEPEALAEVLLVPGSGLFKTLFS